MTNFNRLTRHRRAITNTGAAVVAAALAIGAALSGPQRAHAQSSSGSLRVAIISPANGGGAAGQSIEAGAFAIVNGTSVTQSVSSVTIAFSDPSIFSSASLIQPSSNVRSPGYNGSNLPGNNVVLSGPSSLANANPAASTTFTFNSPYPIPPGGEPVFALIVKMATSISRNETGNVAYAAMASPAASGAGAPLWMALAIVGLAMAGLPAGKRRRAITIAALVILLTLGAPGCGNDNSSASSTQTVTAVNALPRLSVHYDNRTLPAADPGLPLRLGVVSWH